MGNREALLAGARQCLDERGYARTTARDVAGAAGVSLAAIGYHFGTTEALVREAVFDGVRAWSDDLADVLAPPDGPIEPIAHAEATWNAMTATFARHRGPLAASFEMLTQVPESPEIRGALAGGIARARAWLATLFHEVDPTAEPERARSLGAFHYTVMSGLLVQWLVDPDDVPTGRDLALAVREIGPVRGH